MERKQLFGWTEPELPTEGYVKTLMAFANGDETVDVEIRDRDGKIVSITIPNEQVQVMGSACHPLSQMFGSTEA